MAPISKKTKRPSLRHRAATSKPAPPASTVATTSRSNKQIKRNARHEHLLTRVRASAISKTTHKPTKRRRPQKKLPAADTLGTLRDALPDDDEGEWEGFSDDDATGRRRRREGRIVMKSLKHKPGASKRKEGLRKGEVERFGRNLAQLARGADGESSGDEAGRRKWEALRAYIGSTMEREKAFDVK